MTFFPVEQSAELTSESLITPDNPAAATGTAGTTTMERYKKIKIMTILSAPTG
jgi:hypothetical protein